MMDSVIYSVEYSRRKSLNIVHKILAPVWFFCNELKHLRNA